MSAWVADVASKARAKHYDLPGVGQYYAVDDPALAGGVVFHNDHFVHASLFPRAE